MVNRQTAMFFSVTAIVVVVSAFTVVSNSYKSRQLFIELHSLSQDFNQMRVEFGRLQLEQSTWSSPAMIERIASDQLSMHVPINSQIVRVSLRDMNLSSQQMLAVSQAETVRQSMQVVSP